MTKSLEDCSTERFKMLMLYISKLIKSREAAQTKSKPEEKTNEDKEPLMDYPKVIPSRTTKKIKESTEETRKKKEKQKIEDGKIEECAYEWHKY